MLRARKVWPLLSPATSQSSQKLLTQFSQNTCLKLSKSLKKCWQNQDKLHLFQGSWETNSDKCDQEQATFAKSIFPWGRIRSDERQMWELKCLLTSKVEKCSSTLMCWREHWNQGIINMRIWGWGQQLGRSTSGKIPSRKRWLGKWRQQHCPEQPQKPVGWQSSFALSSL